MDPEEGVRAGSVAEMKKPAASAKAGVVLLSWAPASAWRLVELAFREAAASQSRANLGWRSRPTFLIQVKKCVIHEGVAI